MNITTVLGLAVGIDYSLLILQRYREERAAGRAQADAIAQLRAHRVPDGRLQRHDPGGGVAGDVSGAFFNLSP